MLVRELHHPGLCSSIATPGQHQREHPREAGSARKAWVPERATGQTFDGPGGLLGRSLSGPGRAQGGWGFRPRRAAPRVKAERGARWGSGGVVLSGCRRRLLAAKVQSRGGRDPGGATRGFGLPGPEEAV
ncbi:hypothetical protein NDU88_000676 [Pleurodeles waltl]|uniref:Uncharacterized protein n=1 Tax=Pleurodeles waltl TaxID=8319 RepID=A0AAV7KQW0_PLEWA|nr:hypothetical protein NDU88_000676 [Pleurodeles waltl]